MASVTKRPNGQWRARYRDDGGKEHARHFPRKVDANRWLDEITATVVTGVYTDPDAGRITFDAFYQEWSQRQVWAPGTHRAMDLAAATTFAKLPMKAIKRSHVEQWVKAMNSPTATRLAPLAPGTIHTRYVNVRSVFRAAVIDRVIASDPTDGVALPRRRRPDQAMRISAPAEVGRAMAAAEPQFRAFVAVCAFAGLRLGEAAGLQVGDIDFLRRTVHIARQIQRENGGFEVRPPKYGSERTVAVPDAVLEYLAEHIRGYRPGIDPGRWVFVTPDGTPPHQNTVGYFWRKALAAGGVEPIRLHDLRHFYASGLIAAGCDVVTVQRALGHASATTTLGTYSHLWPTAEDRTRSAAAQIFSEAILADSLRTRTGA